MIWGYSRIDRDVCVWVGSEFRGWVLRRRLMTLI